MIDMITRRTVRQLRTLIRRGTVALSSLDGFLQVAAFDGEQFEDVELLQQYGFASRPPANADVLVCKLGAAGEDAVAFATGSADRPALEAGEVCVHGPSDKGAEIRFKADGSIVLLAPQAAIHVGGPTGEAMLLGATVKAALLTFANAVAAATTVPQIAAAATTLASSTASWLATRGKVT